MYDQLAFNTIRLLSVRLKKMFSEVLEGNHNPYTREQATDDAQLKATIEKHYQKLIKMEEKKYSKPFMSQSLADMATFIGCVKNS